MGYDSNKKSLRSQQQQRLTIVLSAVSLCVVIFVIISLLGGDSGGSSKPGAASRGDHSVTASKLMRMRKAGLLQQGEVDAQRPADGGRQAAGDVGDPASGLRQKAGQKKAAGRVMTPPERKIDQRKSADVGGHGKAPPALSRMDTPAEQAAAKKQSDLDSEVRAIKATGVIMEADEHSLEVTGRLQDATRELIKLRYGDPGEENFRIKFDLEFQPTIPDFAEKGKDGTLVIELAPIKLLPVSVFNFLEIARTWKKGAFHRNAGHVLQAMSRSEVTRSMPFQEYSEFYPHKKGTIGYAGRPSGPEFYVSIQDNSQNHGPGSQQKKNPYEADCIIGTVVQGMEDGTAARIHTMPGREFIGDKKKWVWIRRMHIMVPDGRGGYVGIHSSPDVIPAD